jgi:hypothetical protein
MVPFEACVALPTMTELKEMLALTTCTLRQSVQSGAKQQKQLEHQHEQFELQNQRFELISHELLLTRQKTIVHEEQLSGLSTQTLEQGTQLEKLQVGQKQQSAKLDECMTSIDDLKKALSVQGPAIGKKIDAIQSYQSSELNSFPLHLKKVFALLVSNLMDSKHGFVACFPTIATDDKGQEYLVFMICLPLLMQGILLFDKVLARKVSISNLRALIAQHLPLLEMSDELYEDAHRTFPCTQYKGPRGRKAGKVQKEKFCVLIHENALLPVLQQVRQLAHQFGYKAGLLLDEVAKKDFRELPGKNQMWIGVHSDTHLGNWGGRVNVVALHEDVPAFNEFIKRCLRLNGSSSSSGASGIALSSNSVEPTYHFNGLTLFQRKTRENEEDNLQAHSHGALKSPGASAGARKSPRQHVAPRKEPRVSVTGHGLAEAMSNVIGKKKSDNKHKRRREQEETQAFFEEQEGEGEFQDEGLRRVAAETRKKAKNGNDADVEKGSKDDSDDSSDSSADSSDSSADSSDSSADSSDSSDESSDHSNESEEVSQEKDESDVNDD